jgi:hypothetical protein
MGGAHNFWRGNVLWPRHGWLCPWWGRSDGTVAWQVWQTGVVPSRGALGRDKEAKGRLLFIFCFIS